MLELLATIGAFAAFLAALTQVVKVQFGLKGRVVFLVSLVLGVILGCLFAWGGLLEFRVLRDFPSLGSGALLGLLAGLGASGGTDFVTGVQRNGAKYRAEYTPATDYAPAPTQTPDEWQPATLDDLTRTRTDWPAAPLDR